MAVELSHFEGGLSRLQLREAGKRYPAHLTEWTPGAAADQGPLAVNENGRLAIGGLVSPEGLVFGVNEESWMLALEVPVDALYFGLGQKFHGRLELSGVRTTFWNTDVWSDFHFAHWENHSADPPYFSTPYLIVRLEDRYLGILVSTAYPAYFETPGKDDQRVFVEWQRTHPALLFGALGGQPDVWFLEAPTLAELTKRLQTLVGVTPAPPIWSLGYHQSKWGYASEADLQELDRDFTQAQVPCDGLWLDIDYMVGYRVFSIDDKLFPQGMKRATQKLKKTGRRVVPILDPGVKLDPDYEPYQDGVKKKVFCQKPEGGEYVGMVWPGETVFPDFTLPAGRKWWASRVKTFAQQGIEGCWVDMNDPSTGPVEPYSMRFNRGKNPHAAHRNEYALGMQRATYQGFLLARPNQRPFILSRSGFTGSSRYAAIWSGDNYANYFHLRMAIPCALGMSLSGLPFNGCDLGGFGGEPTEQLLLDWYKATFLWPVLRNHSGLGSKRREPYRFKGEAFAQMKHYIESRYRLMPYLYALFGQQETEGAPLLRPLMYELNLDAKTSKISDEFFVGPFVLQAPLIDENRTRTVVLPGDEVWLDANTGKWESGSQEVTPKGSETPLYLRNGTILPTGDLLAPEVHLFIAPETVGETSFTLFADDGLSFDYRQGARSMLRISLKWDAKQVEVRTETLADGFGTIQPSFVLHGDQKANLERAGQASLNLTGHALMGRRLQ